MNQPIKTQKAQLKRVFENFLSLSVVQWANYLLPLLLIPYLVRTLGLELYGSIVFAQSLLVFFHLFIDFGFDYSATKLVAINRSRTQFLSKLYWTIFYVKLIFIFFSILVLSLILWIFCDQLPGHSIIYWLTFLSVICQALVPNWFFQGVEDMKYVAVFNLLARTLYFLSVFLFVKTAGDYHLVPALNFVAFFFVLVMSMIFVSTRYEITFLVPKKSSIAKQISESRPFFYARFLGNIASASCVLVLGLFLNSGAVGIFSLAEKVMKAYQGAASSASRALYPYMSRTQVFEKYQQFLRFPFAINLIILSFLYFAAEDVFLLIFSGTSSNAFEVFQVLIFALIFSIPSILIGYPLLGAGKAVKEVNNSTIIGVTVLLFVVFSLVITKNVAISNIAYTYVAMEVIIFFLRAFYVFKRSYL